MKTLFVSLVAFFFAFIIGCQENSITDPVMNDSGSEFTTSTAPEINKDILDYYPGAIKLSGFIYDPSHRLNSFAEIKGTVRYRLEQIYTGQRPPRSAIKVKLYVNAVLLGGCNKADRTWTVVNTAEEVFYPSSANQLVLFMEKSFRVRNTCCAPLNLILKFQVNEKKVTLVSTKLEIVRGIVPIPDPQM